MNIFYGGVISGGQEWKRSSTPGDSPVLILSIGRKKPWNRSGAPLQVDPPIPQVRIAASASGSTRRSGRGSRRRSGAAWI